MTNRKTHKYLNHHLPDLFGFPDFNTHKSGKSFNPKNQGADQ